MYWYLPKITYEIYISNSGYLLSGHEQGCEGFVVNFRIQKGADNKKLGKKWVQNLTKQIFEGHDRILENNTYRNVHCLRTLHQLI